MVPSNNYHMFLAIIIYHEKKFDGKVKEWLNQVYIVGGEVFFIMTSIVHHESSYGIV